MATARDSTLYDNLHVKKQLGDARDVGGRTVKHKIALTVVSAAAAGDTYKVAVVPANARVVDAFLIGDGNGASAGSGVNAELGDADDADRFIKAFDADAADASARLNNFAGMNFTPSSDTDVIVKFTTAAPKVGSKMEGYIEYVPGT